MRRRNGLAPIVSAVVAFAACGSARAQVDPDDFANKPAEIEPLAAQSLLLDLATAGTRMVAVGERGHVLLSDDHGATWRQAKSVPTRAMLTAVFFADNEYGWAVGHDETILNTVDGGETWTRSHFAPEAQQPLARTSPPTTVAATGRAPSSHRLLHKGKTERLPRQTPIPRLTTISIASCAAPTRT